jgi:hypothetical protein
LGGCCQVAGEKNERIIQSDKLKEPFNDDGLFAVVLFIIYILARLVEADVLGSFT